MRTDQFLRKFAWNYIIEQNIRTLPVDVFNLVKQNGYLIYDYTKLAIEANKPFGDITQAHGNDGFTFWSVKYKNFVIAYNEKQIPKRIRWTIMHELGHIALNHITKRLPTLSRQATKNYEQLEHEANGFARRILCPSIVLHKVNAYEPDEISTLCNISKQAAAYRSNYMKQLKERKLFLTDRIEKKVLNQFSDFIYKYNTADYHKKIEQKGALVNEHKSKSGGLRSCQH